MILDNVLPGLGWTLLYPCLQLFLGTFGWIWRRCNIRPLGLASISSLHLDKLNLKILFRRLIRGSFFSLSISYAVGSFSSHVFPHGFGSTFHHRVFLFFLFASLSQLLSTCNCGVSFLARFPRLVYFAFFQSGPQHC